MKNAIMKEVVYINFEGLEQYLNGDNTRYNMLSLDVLNYYLKQYVLTIPFKNMDVQNEMKVSAEVKDI
ncbi:hypothetical protein W728_00514 [Staphylococcus aureus VET1884R]|uniref:acetyltransferase n=1 Tax=Staphylococcus aureus TaxID=1280 RepID=UPI000458A45E|nr:acetyltransferase [Staphylococcus aureus]KAI07435.1 hypothetical protein W728_00514 [Staphylococcus aureus VET1884R]